jgi:hypothetical protein
MFSAEFMFTPEDNDAYQRLSAGIRVHLRSNPLVPPHSW